MAASLLAERSRNARRPQSPTRLVAVARGCLTVAAMGAVWGGAAALAEAQATPEAVVHRAIDDAFAVLRDPRMRGPQHRDARMQALRHIADRAFDWEEMAKQSLGAHWRRLSPAQRRDFVDVFQQLLAQEYIDDIDQMRGDEHVAYGTVQHTDGMSVVPTVITTHSGEHVPMSYYLRAESSGPRVYDVSVEGVSLVRHYRETLGRFLVNHGFDELMTRLKQRAAAS